MASLDEFKEFIKSVPGIRNEVLDGTYTWQQLYEIYSLYGKDDKVFAPYLNVKKEEEGSLDLNKVMYIFKNLDLEAVGRSLDGIQKVLNIVIKMTDKEGNEESFYKDRRL